MRGASWQILTAFAPPSRRGNILGVALGASRLSKCNWDMAMRFFSYSGELDRGKFGSLLQCLTRLRLWLCRVYQLHVGSISLYIVHGHHSHHGMPWFLRGRNLQATGTRRNSQIMDGWAQLPPRLLIGGMGGDSRDRQREAWYAAGIGGMV